MQLKTKILLGIAITSLLFLEIFCAKLAYETLGEIDSGLYFFLIILNTVPLILFILKKKNLAAGLLLAIALIIIPYQLYLGNRLLALKEESGNIVAYMYEYHKQSQKFPDELSGYTYHNPDLEKFFSYYKEGVNDARLAYYVGSPNTSHYFQTETKQWGYYPD